ncbi:aminotransferase [Hydrogenispora ethanolica]|jgi:aminotransferase|uniref:Aminotransferase n=1 Tax=Hydrogenispora ethanolica TaxID=1082276 RepID=A0A4R1RVC4_HYDET|nr:aminotransferase class I/II-fold pyridoxal phosphate-dependent enzyme [Hydrogenispora ethanolica]TCL70060.1 aminotransferase [Hydrogenispora ethanolica]
MTRSWINPVVQAIPPSGIRRFFDLVSEMKGVISLGVGEPDFVTPWHIREACFYSLEKGYTMYTSNYGLLELREEIALDLERNYQVGYDPRHELLVTVGVSEAIDLAFRAILEPGDEVIVPQPCYVSYNPCILMAGGRPVNVETWAAAGFQVLPRDIEAVITPKTKALLLCYPNNPTGGVLTPEVAQGIAALARKHDLLVLSDEVYAHLTYEGQHVCLAALPGMKERTILFNGFSKAYAMTGWRLGYAAGPAEIIQAMTKIHQFTMLCAPITAQKAAIEALRHGEAQRSKMVAEYNRRRRLFVKGLNEIGMHCFEPKGAFYAFPSIAVTGMNSLAFSEALLREEKVAVVPGDAFGQSGEGYVRCSYASSMANLQEALVRMGRFIEKHRQSAG